MNLAVVAVPALVALTAGTSDRGTVRLVLRSTEARQCVLQLRNDSGSRIAIEASSIQGEKDNVVETGACAADGPRHLRDGARVHLPGARTRYPNGVVENSYIPGFLMWVLPGHEITLLLPRDEETRPEVVFFRQAETQCEAGAIRERGPGVVARAQVLDGGSAR